MKVMNRKCSKILLKSLVSCFCIATLFGLLISCADEYQITNESDGSTDMKYALAENFEKFKIDALTEIQNKLDQLRQSHLNEKRSDVVVKKRLDELNQNLAYLQESTNDIEFRVNLENERLGLLEDELRQLSSPDYQEEPVDKNQQAKAEIELPFDTSGIVVWGDHILVSIFDRGKFVFLSKGETIEDWLVDNIDSVGGSVEFRHQKTSQTIVETVP